MYLLPPNLDDRKFQDLVNEAKRLIPQFCPTWTDHNVSDPGITLIELFAWMTEQYLYRLNQVPDKNYIAFLDLIGVRLEPARPARGDVTFDLTAEATEERRVIIPAWTEVATERTETKEAIVFTTDAEAEVRPGTVRWMLTTADNQSFERHKGVVEATERVVVWPSADPKTQPQDRYQPQASQAFYLGFVEDLSAHTLDLHFECDDKSGARFAAFVSAPWRWEVWRNAPASETEQWVELDVARDGTRGLNETGEVRFYLPYGCAPHSIDVYGAKTWLRCSPLANPGGEQVPYGLSPRITHVEGKSMGITVPVTHAQPIWNEMLGISNGQSAQRFRLQHANLLRPELPDEVVEVEDEQGGWEAWVPKPDFGESLPGGRVQSCACCGQAWPLSDGKHKTCGCCGQPLTESPSFGGSTEADMHYILDPVSGMVEFGPAIRQRDRTAPQFGAIPPQGRRIRMRRYRIGGGVQGNVAAGHVKLLKTTINYVRSEVRNRASLTGGLDAQTLEDAKLRGPARLRTRYRAVTPDDYEYLAQEVEGVGRVRCLQPNPDDPVAPAPGTVQLLVIPDFPPLEGERLAAHVQLRDKIQDRDMNDRRRGIIDALFEELRLPEKTEMRLRDYLRPRRLLTTRLRVSAPEYVWVSVQLRFQAEPRADRNLVEQSIKESLYQYLHPLYGGPDRRGWPFGQALTVDKIYALMQTIEGVAYASRVKLYRIDMSDRSNPLQLAEDPARPGQALSTDEIPLPANGVFLSYRHIVNPV